ncbi:MAG: hypothetical protein E1N59_1276 [Puniceicoccaceae bacterium 5H]|nr:MAG: hypothetical protein E1N59_1276 [Puniceicoccaceae bacterium 5H]
MGKKVELHVSTCRLYRILIDCGMETLFMVIGFLLAAYAIVANDSIQTLGTFLASNSKRPWWLLFAFAATVMVATILWGWFHGDATHGRLNKFPDFTEIHFNWTHLVAPAILLALTRWGFPVSTSFLILLVFMGSALPGMLTKTIIGYGVALGLGLVIYLAISRLFEQKWSQNPAIPGAGNGEANVPTVEGNLQLKAHEPAIGWVIAQWVSTAVLWSGWLTQDLANVFIYLPRPLDTSWLIGGLAWMVVIQAFIFWSHGGAIQRVVLQKRNTVDIRSATLIDLLYGVILWYFKFYNSMPMSTTWVFIGLLAGREIGLRMMDRPNTAGVGFKLMALDLAKAGTGLAVSVLIALGLPVINTALQGSADLSALHNSFNQIAAAISAVAVVVLPLYILRLREYEGLEPAEATATVQA